MDIQRIIASIAFVMAMLALAVALSGCTTAGTFEPICREEADHLLEADSYYASGRPGFAFRESRRQELFNQCTSRFVRANTQRAAPVINVLLGAGARTFNEHGYGLYPATPVYVVPRQ